MAKSLCGERLEYWGKRSEVQTCGSGTAHEDLCITWSCPLESIHQRKGMKPLTGKMPQAADNSQLLTWGSQWGHYSNRNKQPGGREGIYAWVLCGNVVTLTNLASSQSFLPVMIDTLNIHFLLIDSMLTQSKVAQPWDHYRF